jgi:hypothetical protein
VNRGHERARRVASQAPHAAGGRKAHRSKAKPARAYPPEPENKDPLAGLRFRVCTCVPTNYSDHAQCVRAPEDESEF